MTETRDGTPASGSAGGPPPQTGRALDPRRHAYRADLAAAGLEGQVDAQRFVHGFKRQVIWASVPLRRKPDIASGIDTEALYGEVVTEYEARQGWSWVQLDRDGYVGYLPSEAISGDVREPTHRVKSLGTFLYAEPDIKSAPLMHLSLNSELSIVDVGERLSRTDAGHWVVTRHIGGDSRFARDFVDVAERLVGTPYLWGGKTRIGLDCSGLVQVSMHAAGLACPRDSDMQQAEVGTDVLVPADLEGLQRGDLVLWKGHIGIMADGLMLVHANAHHMSVVVETLPEAVDRIARSGSRVAAIKRVEPLSA